MPSQFPPGFTIPSAVQMLWLAFKPISFLETNRRLFGDTFTVRIKKGAWVTLSNPEDIKAVFTGKPEDLWAGPANAVLKPVLRQNSLLLIDAPRHLSERKIMNPAFHGERMLAYGGAMAELTEKALASWPKGRRFAMHPRLQELTLDIILRTVFGMTDPARYAELRRLVVKFLGAAASPALLALIRPDGELTLSGDLMRKRGIPFSGLFRMLDRIDALLYAEFARRRREGVAGREDILSQFLAMQDEAGVELSDAWLRDEMMTLLLAGHETTATALAWLFYHLGNNPAVEAKLFDELAAAGGRDIVPHEAAKLPYLDAVIKESMRLTPVITWVGRRLERPMQIGRWNLPAGTMVLPSIYLTHHNPEVWPDPERFDPMRFFNQPANPNAFFPFGGGARRCIGMAFANYEIKVVAARVLTRYKIRLPKNYSGAPVRRSITLTPKDGLPVTLVAR